MHIYFKALLKNDALNQDLSNSRPMSQNHVGFVYDILNGSIACMYYVVFVVCRDM